MSLAERIGRGKLEDPLEVTWRKCGGGLKEIAVSIVANLMRVHS